MDDPQWWRFRLRSGSTMPADSSFCCKQAKVPNAGHSNRLILLTNCCYRLIRSVCTEYSTRIIKGIIMSLNNTFRVYSSFLPTRVKIRPRCFPSQFLGPITLYPGILANRGASTTSPPPHFHSRCATGAYCNYFTLYAQPTRLPLVLCFLRLRNFAWYCYDIIPPPPLPSPKAARPPRIPICFCVGKRWSQTVALYFSCCPMEL